jgi:predicted aspartyl protease
MIRGTVNYNHEAVVPLRFRGPGGAELDVDAVIDTAYTGLVILPPATISALNLVYQTDTLIRLGDGTARTVGVYDAEMEWDGVWRGILVTEIDSTPLIGTGLLARHELFIEFVPGGVVDITRMP